MRTFDFLKSDLRFAVFTYVAVAASTFGKVMEYDKS